MKLKHYFWALGIFTVLATLSIVIPYVATFSNTFTDGFAMIGFPLPIAFFGGRCLGGCALDILWIPFVINILIIGTITLASSYLLLKRENTKTKS